MRKNLLSAGEWLLAFSLFLALMIPLKALPLIPEDLQGAERSQTQSWIVDNSVFTGNFGLNQNSFALAGPCDAASPPYFLNFSDDTAVDCVTILNAGSGNNWSLGTGADSWGFPGRCAYYAWNTYNAANAWLFTKQIVLVAGQDYEISYKYGSAGYTEKMKVAYGISNSVAGMTNLLADHPSITTSPLTNTVQFSPSVSGTYYFGFNCYSARDQYYLFLNDISIMPVSSCDPSTGLNVTNITTSSATLSWAGDGDIVEYGEAGFALGTGTRLNSVSSPQNISALTNGTSYEFYVGKVCPDETMAWSAPKGFTTVCDIAPLPYSMDFSDVGNCITISKTGNGNNWTIWTGTGSLGYTEPTAGVVGNNNALNAWIYMKAVYLEGGQFYKISYRYSAYNAAQKMKVAYGTSNSAAAMTNIIKDYPSITNTSAVMDVVQFSPAASGTYYIGFNAYSAAAAAGTYIFLDDVLIEYGDTCDAPTDLDVDNITTDSAELSWSGDGTVVEWGEAGFTRGEGTVINGVSSPYTLSGLDSGTSYDFYVGNVCPDESVAWSLSYGFTTECEAQDVPYYLDFDDNGNLNCVMIEKTSGNLWSLYSGGETYGFDGLFAAYMYSVTEDADSWIFTEGLNLVAGNTYKVSYKYGSRGYDENMKVSIGSSATIAGMTTELASHENFTETPLTNSVEFSVPADGTYYIGFGALSEKDNFAILLDDIAVELVDEPEPENIWENGYWSEGVPVKLNSGRKLIFRSDFNSLAGAMSDGSGMGNTNKYGRIWGTSAVVEAGVNVVFNSDHALILDNELIVDSDNGASLTFKSGAVLGQKNNAAVNQGEINFEREFYMSPQKGKYNLVSSPVKDFFMQDVYPGSPKVFKYAEKTDKFKNADAGEYIAGKGYRVNEKEQVFAEKNSNLNATITTGVFTGVPANGKMNYKITFKGNGINLIGNPYPSVFTLDKFYDVNEDLITESFFFWDNRGLKSGDHYATYNVLTETGVAAMAPAEAGLDERIPTNEVAAGTGFFVLAKKQGKVKFNNSMRLKTDSDEPEFFGKTQTKDRYWLTMTTPENQQAMTAVVYFGAGDNGFAADDSKSLYNNDVLYTLVDDNQLVIQGKAAFEKSDVVAVGIKVTEDGTHSIALAKQEGVFENGQTVYLRDKQTGAVHNLSAQPYSFTSSVGEYNDRFEIIYNNFGQSNDMLTQNGISIEKKDQNIVITSTMENIAAVEIFNLTGAPVYSKSNINANQFSVPVSLVGNQIIVVKVNTVDGKVVNKKFINQ